MQLLAMSKPALPLLCLLALSACAPVEGERPSLSAGGDKADGDKQLTITLTPDAPDYEFDIDCDEWVSCQTTVRAVVDNLGQLDPGIPAAGDADPYRLKDLVSATASYYDDDGFLTAPRTIQVMHDDSGLYQFIWEGQSGSTDTELFAFDTDDEEERYTVKLHGTWFGPDGKTPIKLRLSAHWE
jgi:hypothetical protein